MALSSDNITLKKHPPIGPFYAPPVPPPAHCPICDGVNVRSIGQFYDGFGGKELVDLYFCFDCEGATFPYAKPRLVSNNTNWHLKVRDRNRGFANDLLDAIGIPEPIILDIGCGIGTVIEVAHERGGGGTGFELNAACVTHGKDNGFDLRRELWTLDTVVPPPTLITCIMVLEHIHQPRALLGDLIRASKKFDAPVFISVPWFGHHNWSHVETPIDELPNHMFNQPTDHVTFFAMNGFKKVAQSFGATEYPMIRAGWTGFLVK